MPQTRLEPRVVTKNLLLWWLCVYQGQKDFTMRGYGARRWSLCLLFLIATQAIAAIELTSAEPRRSIVAAGETLTDDADRIDLASAIVAPGWQASAHHSLLLGPGHGDLWFHVRLHNTDQHSLARVLEIDSAMGQHVSIALLDDQGRWITGLLSGGRPFAARAIPFRHPTLAFSLLPDRHADLYLHVHSDTGLPQSVPLVLWSPAGFNHHLHSDDIQYGLYFGILTALILYNLFLFISLTEAVFAWYAVYATALMFWDLIRCGYASEYLWPTHPTWNIAVTGVLVPVALFAFIRFSLHYLDIPARQKDALRWSFWLSLLCLLDVLPFIAGDAWLSDQIVLPLLVLVAVFFGLLALRAYHARQRHALYYFVASALLLSGLLWRQATLMGWNEHIRWAHIALQWDFVSAMLIFALGLAWRLRQQDEQGLPDELMNATQIGAHLEAQVRERTQELEKSRQMLLSLAITDELTGAYNRRHFNEVLRLECQRRRRSPQSITLCLVDVDHFKSYNDRYGHPAGDAALVALAQALRSRLRRAGDRLFRLGGEEFALLLEIDNGSKARDFAESLRASIKAMQYPHADSPDGFLSASFGILHLSASASTMEFEELYAATDALLYLAKARGRDCVETQWR